MSFLSELKRRNVFRVAAAYAVSSWLLIEVGSLLFDAFEFPDWAAQLLIVILALGFVPVLIFSWAYELTPDGLKRDKGTGSSGFNQQAGRRLDQVTIAMILLALGVIVVNQFILEGRVRPADETAQTAAPADERAPAAEAPVPLDSKPFEPDEKSVAVLPFANMSADADNEYFSDGISEELLNLLAGQPDLRVPSRTSSFAFKGQNTDIREIARALDVAHVLEGSVRKAGDRVRITAQLIDVRDDRHLWSETYDRELTDIFAIQDEIAGHIVEALQVALGTELSATRSTDNLEAYDLYLQGQHFMRQRDQGLVEAERLLKQSLAIDPDYAQAWATLAVVYVLQPNYLGIPMQDVEEALENAAAKALALEPTLAEPKLALALALMSRREWITAKESLQAVVTSHPNHPLARHWYGITLLQLGYIGQAKEHLTIGQRIDPLSSPLSEALAGATIMNGDLKGGREQLRRSSRLGRPGSWVMLGLTELGEQGLDAGLLSIAGAPDNVREFLLGMVQVLRNPAGEQAFLAQVPQWGTVAQGFRPSYYYMLAGRPEAYFSAIEAETLIDDSVLVGLWYPWAADMRSSPQFLDFAQRMELTEAWRRFGPPDTCEQLEGGRFQCR